MGNDCLKVPEHVNYVPRKSGSRANISIGGFINSSSGPSIGGAMNNAPTIGGAMNPAPTIGGAMNPAPTIGGADAARMNAQRMNDDLLAGARNNCAMGKARVETQT